MQGVPNAASDQKMHNLCKEGASKTVKESILRVSKAAFRVFSNVIHYIKGGFMYTRTLDLNTNHHSDPYVQRPAPYVPAPEKTKVSPQVGKLIADINASASKTMAPLCISVGLGYLSGIPVYKYLNPIVENCLANGTTLSVAQYSLLLVPFVVTGSVYVTIDMVAKSVFDKDKKNQELDKENKGG